MCNSSACLVTKAVPEGARLGTPPCPFPRPLDASEPVCCVAESGVGVSGAWRMYCSSGQRVFLAAFVKHFGRAVAVGWGAGELIPYKPHLCCLQCPSTDCSMSIWCLQAATLLWRWGGRSTQRRRCMLTSWALSQSGCARATASVRSTSRKVTVLRWGLEAQIGLCSQLFREKCRVCHLSRVAGVVEEGAIFSK